MSKNKKDTDDLPYSGADSDGVDDFTEGVDYFNVDGDEVKVSKEQLEDYNAIFEKSGWDKVKAFLKAENKWGRRAKVVKDFALLFVPYGRRITNITEMATELTKDDTMLQDKKWYQSKTIWSAIIILVTAVLQAAGVDLMANPELTATVYEVAMLLAGAFGLYGLRDAISRQKGRLEDKATGS